MYLMRKLSHKPKKAPGSSLRRSSAASESSPVPLGVPTAAVPSASAPQLFVYSTPPLALQNEKGEVIKEAEAVGSEPHQRVGTRTRCWGFTSSFANSCGPVEPLVSTGRLDSASAESLLKSITCVYCPVSPSLSTLLQTVKLCLHLCCLLIACESSRRDARVRWT